MVTVKRAMDRPKRLTIKALFKLASKPSEDVETNVVYRINGDERELFQVFSILIKAKFYLSPFFDVVKPVTFHPGTAKFDPPKPFSVKEVKNGFNVGFTVTCSWRSVYVIMVILDNVLAWVKSDAGQATIGTKRKLKHASFEAICLRGEKLWITKKPRVVPDEPDEIQAVTVADTVEEPAAVGAQ